MGVVCWLLVNLETWAGGVILSQYRERAGLSPSSVLVQARHGARFIAVVVFLNGILLI